MEVVYRQPQSFYGAARVSNHVGTLNDNGMRVARNRDRTSPPCSSYYYEPSPRRDRKRRVEIVSKPPPGSSWWNDNDMKRKRRVAKYKLYATEGKLKSCLTKGLRSFKITCSKIVANI